MPLPTVCAMPAERDLGWSFAETRRRYPGIAGQDMVVAMFAEIAAESTVDALLPEFERVRPDLVVYEAFDVGAGVAAAVLGIRAAAFRDRHVRTGRSPRARHGRSGAGPTVGRARPPGAGADVAAGRGLSGPDPPGLHAGASSTPSRLPIQPQAWSESIGELPGWLSAERIDPRAYITLGTGRPDAAQRGPGPRRDRGGRGHPRVGRPRARCCSPIAGRDRRTTGAGRARR